MYKQEQLAQKAFLAVAILWFNLLLLLMVCIGPYRPNEMVGHDLIWRHPKCNYISEKQLKLKVSMCQVSTLHPNFLRLTSYKNIVICIRLIESKA